eukprot:1509007-Prymnesium_polylepis.1
MRVCRDASLHAKAIESQRRSVHAPPSCVPARARQATTLTSAFSVPPIRDTRGPVPPWPLERASVRTPMGRCVTCRRGARGRVAAAGFRSCRRAWGRTRASP